ncbi:Uncharacterised protein [Comamonas aquatica]|nr:Uncharacterised protein [Comamonas aquatica]
MNRRTCIGLAFALVGSAAMAQTYPTKPIKLLVPFAPRRHDGHHCARDGGASGA